MFLPWFAGNVIDQNFGIVSIWGIYYNGRMHLAHEIYAAGFWDIVTFLLPSLLYCSYFSERKWSGRSVGPSVCLFNLVFWLLWLVVLLPRAHLVFQVTSSYGPVAGFLS